MAESNRERKLGMRSNTQSDTGPIGLRGRRKKKEDERRAKPSALKGRVSSTDDIKSLRKAQNKAIKAYDKKKDTETPAPTPTPVPRAAAPAPQAPKSSAGKATPKASTSPGKASPASETYKEGGKGLYQGTKAYREKIGGSGNPLLNRFREDMGRSASTGKTQKEMKKDVRQAGKAAGEKVKNLGKSGASVDPGYTPSTKITKNYSDKKPSSQPFETQRRLDKAKASPAEKQKQQTQQNRKEQTNKVVKSGSAMSLAEKLRRKRVGLD